MSQKYGLLLRHEFLKYKIVSIVNFDYDVFDSATVRTCIMQIQKLHADSHIINILDINSKRDLSKFLDRQFSTIKQSLFNSSENKNFRINLTDQKLAILKKIDSNCLSLDTICSVNYGLRQSSEILGLGKNAFLYKENPKGNFKKYFEGKDMGDWLVNHFSYLDYQPEYMYNAMFPELFENIKLGGLCTLSDISKLRFVYDDKGLYCNHSVVLITLWHNFSNVMNSTIRKNITSTKIELSKHYSLKYLQGVLNSKLIKYYFNELYYDGTHFYPNHMKLLPIKPLSESDQKPVINIVDKILNTIINNSSWSTHSAIQNLESALNEIVFSIYGLSSDEVEMINDSFLN